MRLQCHILFTYCLGVFFSLPFVFATSGDADPPTYNAPVHRLGGNRSIENTYVVKFFNGYTLQQHFDSIGVNLSVSHLVRSFPSMPGYHARLEPDLLERVRHDTGVQFIEQDKTKHYHNHTFDRVSAKATSTNGVDASRTSRRWIQNLNSNVDWPLVMMSVAEKLSSDDLYETPAAFIQGAGSGVYIYILDTGIRLTHEVFEGRATNFQDADASEFCNGESMDDFYNHGTAVASIAAGASLSMASSANLVNVKTLCDNKDFRTTSNEIAAVFSIISEHVSRKDKPGFRGSILNLSFGSEDYSESESIAYATARAEGISIVASSGNDGIEVVQYPCAYKGIICIAGSTEDYGILDMSSHGAHVSMFAPGEYIESASAESDSAAGSNSGTSLAVPNAVSNLATFISYEGLYNDAATAEKRLQDNALRDVLEALPSNSPNILVNNGIRRTPQIGIPNQLPYIGAPALGAFRAGAERILQVASSTTEDGGLSGITTVTSTPAYSLVASSAGTIPLPMLTPSSCLEVAVLQWPSYTTTVTISPAVDTASPTAFPSS